MLVRVAAFGTLMGAADVLLAPGVELEEILRVLSFIVEGTIPVQPLMSVQIVCSAAAEASFMMTEVGTAGVSGSLAISSGFIFES